MDFSTVELSPEDRDFRDEARRFLAEHVTDEVIEHDRETGDNFHEDVHLALGAAGYLEGEWTPEPDGGFTRVRRRIWELEKRRHHVPWVTWGTTALVARAVQAFGKPELVDEVMPKVFSGEARMCLGYTEPEGGSDIATCKTRAVRDGDGRRGRLPPGLQFLGDGLRRSPQRADPRGLPAAGDQSLRPDETDD